MKKYFFFTLVFSLNVMAQTNPAPVNSVASPAVSDSETPAPALDRNMMLFESGYWSRRLLDKNKKMRWIGYASSSSSLGYFGTSVLNYGSWEGEKGAEYSLGFSKTADSFSDSTTVTSDTVNRTQTTLVSSSGSKNPLTLTFGYGYNMKTFQNPWILVYWGPLFAVQYSPVVKYSTGSNTTTITDTSAPTTFTVQDSSRGEVTVKRDMAYMAGVRLGSEFFLKWFPQLSLGFATGVITSFGGDTTTTTETISQNQNVTNGTPQAPTSFSQTSLTSKNRSNTSYNTFGIGGTTFNFMGTFTIKYLW